MSLAFALLLDTTVKASLLCLLALVMSGLARRRSAGLRHDLWMAAVACCAGLPVVSAAIRLVGPVPQSAPVHEAVVAVTPSLPAQTPAGAIEIVDRVWSGDGAAAAIGWIATFLVLLWLVGIAIGAMRALSDYRAAAAIVSRAQPFRGAARPAGVPLLITAELSVPAVFGFLSPAILLPADAAAWPAERLHAVLAHELAHVERRDCALELVARLAGVLNWFNPLVLRGLRRLRTERELACDARVMASDVDPHHYAAALVEVARRSFGARQRAMVAMARAPELERRVVLLLGPRRAADRPSRLRPALASAGVALFLSFAAVTAPAAGVLGSGSVQPLDLPMRGLDDPMSELLPFPYDQAAAARAVPAEGPEAAAIATFRHQLHRQSRGYGDLVRERAIWALAQVRAGRVFEPLAARIADSDWRVRASAAWGLARTGDVRATARLLTMLDDPVWRVRAMAAGGLADLADPRAAEGLAAAARDPAWQVRISALQYVERRRDAALARRLRPLLEDPHNGTRLLAESVLSRF